MADALVAHGVPFVVCTGNRADVWDDFRDLAVLRKPYKYDKLVATLTGLLPR